MRSTFSFPRVRAWLAPALILFAMALMHPAHAQIGVRCEEMGFVYGPFDYRTATETQRVVVERRHFTPGVETLTRRESGWFGSDISYTLRAFPNHPRALSAMARLARLEKKPTPTGADLPVECWFQRAMLFAPDDVQVLIVIGIEQLRDNQHKAAIQTLTKAGEIDPDNRNVEYNLGLAFFDLKDYDQALKHAKRAYELGFPLPGLRDKLKRAGKWQD